MILSECAATLPSPGTNTRIALQLSLSVTVLLRSLLSYRFTTKQCELVGGCGQGDRAQPLGPGDHVDAERCQSACACQQDTSFISAQY